MRKVFYLFKARFLFDNDEMTHITIKYICCNKTFNIKFSSFTKSVVFHHVGLSWPIQTKEQKKFAVEEQFIEWCTVGKWLNETNFSEPTWNQI